MNKNRGLTAEEIAKNYYRQLSLFEGRLSDFDKRLVEASEYVGDKEALYFVINGGLCPEA